MVLIKIKKISFLFPNYSFHSSRQSINQTLKQINQAQNVRIETWAVQTEKRRIWFWSPQTLPKGRSNTQKYRYERCFCTFNLEKSFFPRKTQKARKYSKRYQIVACHPKGNGVRFFIIGTPSKQAAVWAHTAAESFF